MAQRGDSSANRHAQGIIARIIADPVTPYLAHLIASHRGCARRHGGVTRE